jgi:predicted nucleic acid-binding protein
LTKTLVADSSPLIVLLKSDLESILPELYEEIIVPEPVWAEVLAGKTNDAAKQKLSELSWAKRMPVEISNEALERYNLGKGETAVLNIALTISESRVLLDDYAARKSAKALGIPTLGTGGLLILAKRQGLIASVTETLEKVQDAGLWLSDEIIKLIKEKAGE